MERLSIPSYSFATKNYCLLMKPGIMMGNAITTAGGFALASKGHLDLWLFVETLVGLCTVIGSACVFNNYIDRHADRKMARTKNRALATGAIAPHKALIFAVLLGLLGSSILAVFTNVLTVAAALFGFFVYVVLYSFSKYYSIHGTLIGSVAGAVPPVVGYSAVSNQLDAGAIIFFAMIVFWQMPHFFAISIYRMRDYAAASIPTLPGEKGMRATKIQMALYILVFLGTSSLLTLFHYTGYAYLALALILSLAWLILCFRGFTAKSDPAWARQMFIFSLVVILGLSAAIPFMHS